VYQILNLLLVPLPGETFSPKTVILTTVSRPTKGPGYVDIPLTGMRLTIAKRLTESKVNIYGFTMYIKLCNSMFDIFRQ